MGMMRYCDGAAIASGRAGTPGVPMTRVVVTGIGVETCVGRTVDAFWSAVSEGRPGIAPISSFDASDLTCQVAGEVDLDPSEALSPANIRRTSRFQQLHHLAAVKSFADGGRSPSGGPEFGIFVGTALGGMSDATRYYKVRESGLELIDRLMVTKAAPNAAAQLTAELLGIHGPSYTFTTTCASSTDAILFAFREIRAGRLDAALASGSEAWVTPDALRVFAKMHVTTTTPPDRATEACRPFDITRDGVTPSEGAVALLLESLPEAERRGARIYAELLGAGSTCDGSHPVRPCPTGEYTAAAIQSALADAGIAPDEIDHVNCHGTSTPLNDVAETLAIRMALGDHADRITATASKSVLGHHFGAGGAAETAVSALSLHHQYLPPTANLLSPDPACDLDYVPIKGRDASIQTMLKLSFGFGGQNTVLVLRRFN